MSQVDCIGGVIGQTVFTRDRAERRPSLATPDFGLGRGDGVPRLGAREVVRVLLPAVLLVARVEDGHPPRETGGVAVQVIYLKAV